MSMAASLRPAARRATQCLRLDTRRRRTFASTVRRDADFTHIWIDDPSDVAPNAARLDEAVKAIREYLPGLDVDALAPDYAGIRPKLLPTGAFHDFVVRKEDGFEGLVSLLGIESPGLTSCLAIAERVEALLYK
ncbi:hypothetical protein VdG2_01023 [Verticillium dahliae VDG2]|nr:hypothetical protein VdG2_01023 [Verticillium dahliae VDG2]